MRSFLPLTLCLLLTLAACDRGGSSKTPSAPAKTKITLLYQPYISFLPYFIAEEEGFFAEQGLEVEMVPVLRGVDGVPLLLTGRVDAYGGTVNVGIFNCIAQGATIKLVADKGNGTDKDGSYMGFVVRREMLESGFLDDPKNWKGLKFDTSPNPDIKCYLLDCLLQQNGLTMEDVEVVPVNAPEDCEALKNGKIDVTCHGEPWIARMIRGGYGAMWKTTDAIYPDFQVAFMLYGKRFVEEEPGWARGSWRPI